MLQNLYNRLTTHPRLLFATDGTGAIVSALMLWLLLGSMPQLFGMPVHILHPLALVAAGFAVYSLTCSVLDVKSANLLMFIALLNTLYCAATALLCVKYHHSLTALGHAYFTGEILIILTLVVVEIKAARVIKETNG
jgi:hypothetical protein